MSFAARDPRQRYTWLERPGLRRLILVGLVLAATGLLVREAVLDTGVTDFNGFVEVGNAARSGGHIYDDPRPGVNTWPPFFSLVCVPLSLLDAVDARLVRVLWTLLSYAALLWSLNLLAQIVHDEPLHLRAGPAQGLSLASPAMLVPVLLTYASWMQNIIDIQIYISLFALVLSGMVLQARGRPLLGGMALALAASIRVMPVVFIPYLIYRRRWRPAAYAVLFLVLFSVSPVVFNGWDRFVEYVHSWTSMESGSWTAGHKNQSVLALWDRYLGHGLIPGISTPSVHRPWTLGPAVWAAAGTTLAAVTAGALWRFRGRIRPDGASALAEWSVVFIVGAVFGPLTWKSYLIVFLAPYVLLYGIWSRGGPGRGLSGTLLAFALLFSTLLSDQTLVGSAIKKQLEMAGCYTITALVLVAGLFVLRGRTEASRPSPPTPDSDKRCADA